MTNRGFILGSVVSLLVEGRGKAPIGPQFINTFQQLLSVLAESNEIPKEGNANKGSKESALAIVLDLILNHSGGTAAWPWRSNDNDSGGPRREIDRCMAGTG